MVIKIPVQEFMVNSEQVFLLCYIIIHKDKMTNTAAHDE